MQKLDKVRFLIILFALLVKYTKSQINKEDLFYSTIKITETNFVNLPKKKVTGSAFFFGFNFGNKTEFVLVTNKHVIENSSNGELLFNEESLNKDSSSKILVKFKDFESIWIKHPTEDIAILPLSAVYERILFHTRKKILIKSYSENNILIGKNDTILNGLQNILMIGYPKGFYDSINNIPILRQGYTATPIHINYNNERKFLADIPIFSGSSGSPVIFYNDIGISRNGQGMIFGVNEFYLLGVATESRVYKDKNSDSWLPLDLATVIKADVILELKESVKKDVILNPKSPYFYTSKILEITVKNK